MDQLTMLVHGYFAVAILYNVFSQISDDLVGRKFAPTDPSYGFMVVSLVYVIFLVRDAIPAWSFLFLFTLWTLSILRFGVGNHLGAYSSKSYLHRLTWASAIGINVYGVCVFTALIFSYAKVWIGS